MTLISTPPVFMPLPLIGTGSTGGGFGGGTASLIDAAGEKYAFVFRAPKAGNIDQISFRTATVTTGDDIDVRLETVDTATGDPTGALVNAGSPGSEATQTVGDGDDNTWFDVALGASGTVVAGTYYAIVIEAPVGYSGVMQIAYGVDNEPSPNQVQTSYNEQYISGAWTKQAATRVPVWRIRYDDASYPYIPTVVTAESFDEYAISSSTTPDEIGIYYTLPKCRCIGFFANSELDIEATVKLYDTDGASVLASQAIDSDLRNTGGHSLCVGLWNSGGAAAPQTLTSGAYRLTWVPDTTTDTARLAYMTFAAAAHKEQMGLANVQKTYQTDGGGFSQLATEVPMMGLILDQLDDGAGGGGGGLLVHPGTSGGARG